MKKITKIIPIKNTNNFNFEFIDEETNKSHFASEASREELIRFMNYSKNPEEVSYAEEIIENQSVFYNG